MHVDGVRLFMLKCIVATTLSRMNSRLLGASTMTLMGVRVKYVIDTLLVPFNDLLNKINPSNYHY